MEVTSNSSIPDEVSKIGIGAEPETNKVFRGFQPSVFYVLMTPSIFTSTLPDYNSLSTGYHVSPN